MFHPTAPSSPEEALMPESSQLDKHHGHDKNDEISLSKSPALGHSLSLLDTLSEFYQLERKWIHQQRISLQDSELSGSPSCSDEATLCTDTEGKSSSSPDPELPKDGKTKAESDKVPLQCITEDVSQSRASASTMRFARWPWSPRVFELELPLQLLNRGLGEPRLILPPAGFKTNLSEEKSCSNEVRLLNTENIPILDLFENMVEGRLETCQRMDRLIRARITQD
ncbi:hypothetical protein GYMLUDRAFT_36803 [Collybiopsis luxurians FD-317 M1]|nr:hypothetical protein GYMLUDRAFT_36803 [Collybiopsis luxurians FD-317 M1]